MTRHLMFCLMFVGHAALAQTVETPPAAAAPPSEAAPATPPPTMAPSGAPTMAPSEPPPAPEPIARIRAGANGAPALFIPGISYGVNFSGRIGVQLKRMWGVYADIGGGFGFGGSISAGTGGGGVSINVADYWRLLAMGEADIGRLFFVSLGAGVCGCTWGGLSQIATQQGAQQAAYVAAGYDPALLARIGVGFGRTRHKFTLAVENMVAFGKMTSVSQNASMNGADQSVRIGNLAVGWAPALVFGWDMR